MSIQPDQLLSRVLINGLTAFRQDPSLIDALLQNLTQRDLQAFKDFFVTNSIDISFNYPRGEAPKLPAIVIQLQNESESEAFLGDMLGQGGSVWCVPDNDMIHDTLNSGHGASQSGLSGLPPKLVGDIQADRSYTDPVTGNGRIYWLMADDFTRIKEGLENRGTDGIDLYVTKGSGIGQKFPVVTLTNKYIDIDGIFDPQLDNSSFIDLRRSNNPTATVGEPSRIFDEDDIYFERKGANYEANYQIMIMAGSQQEVLHLHTVLKALFISQRVFLEAQGLQNFSMSASDFSPRSDYIPGVVFQRAMNCKFKYTFNFVSKLERISRIDFTIKACSMGDEPIDFEVDLRT